MTSSPESRIRRGRRTRTAPDAWTDDQFETLERMYLAGEPMDAITAAVGRSFRACELKIKFLGLRRDHGKRNRWPSNSLSDETARADDLLAERMQACSENFGDHDLRIRSSGRPVSAGIAHLLVEQSLDAYEAAE